MQEVRIPTLGESITEGVIVRWMKKDGDSVAQDEPILELETDKASVEIPAPVAGVIHLDSAEGDTVGVGDRVARIDGDATAAATEPKADVRPPTPDDDRPQTSRGDDAGKAPPPAMSPAVRRLIEENRLDPASIEGSGRGGRLTKADVLAYLRNGQDQAGVGDNATPREAPAATPLPPPPPSPAPARGSEEAVRTPLTRLRRRIAERLLEAQHGAAILTTFNEVDMSAVLDLRKRFKESFEKRHGTRLGFMSFFARACIAAMEDVPLINARIDGDDIVQPNGVNLGVAVGTDRGLVVPIVHGADRMSFAELESNIARLASLAQENKLSIADLSGGTFTISNGGVYGSLMSTPILNPPQSGILGMHKIEKRPVVVDDEIVVRPMMYLALSYDHRLIDGEGAVTFLVHVKERLESPERLLLEI